MRSPNGTSRTTWRDDEGLSPRRIWVAAIILGVAAGAAIGLAPVPAVLVFTSIVLVVLVALNPEFALSSVLVTALVMLGVSSTFTLPPQAMLLTRILIGVFALSVLLQFRREGHVQVHLSAAVAWVAVLTVSALVGVSSKIVSLQALWAYVCGPAAFLAILYSNLSARALRRMSLLVAVIIVAELPIVLYQNAFVATSVDQIGGTFGTAGGTTLMAIVMGLTWTAAVAGLTGRRRIWLIPIAVGVATILLVSEAKAGFLFCAIGTVAVGLARGVLTRRFATVSIRYVAIAAAAIAALYAGYAYAGAVLKGGERAAATMFALITNPSTITQYLFAYGPQGQAGRLEGVRLALTLGRSALADMLLGKGPGLLSSSALLGSSSAIAQTMGTMFDWATSLTRSILETGVLGTLLYLGVVVSAVWTVADSWRPRGSQLGTSVIAGCVGFATVFLVSGLYGTPWHTDAVAIVFWCLMGIAAKWGQLLLAERGEPASAVQEAAEAHP
jgi:hypothetical protein